MYRAWFNGFRRFEYLVLGKMQRFTNDVRTPTVSYIVGTSCDEILTISTVGLRAEILN